MKSFVVLVFILIFTFQSKGQEEDKYLQVGVHDADQLVKGYLQPLFKTIGYGFTSGWYTTAKCHETLGFDFLVMANVVYIPSGELSFTFRNRDFDNIQLVDGSKAQAPTVFGSQKLKNRPDLIIQDQNDAELVRASAPPGVINLKKELGANIVPIPMVQFGMGIYKYTDLSIRFFPNTQFDKINIRMMGVGIKHNIRQWIPHLQYTDVDLAFLVAYNSMRIEADLPESRTLDNRATFGISGLNIQTIISKEYFKIFTFFSGFGYSRAASRTQLLGEYPINEKYTQIPMNPLDLKYSESSVNFSMGATINLLLARISASQTFQKYPVTNLSIGLSFR